MAKPKADPGMQVSLFPFLSILACLIGALVLMIVIQTISQTEKIDGRTEEEVVRAERYMALQEQLKQENATKDELESLIDDFQKAEAEAEETRKKNVLLSGTLDISGSSQEEKAKRDAELQQILENLQADVNQWKQTKPEIDQQIKDLLAQIKEKNIKPDDTPPPVIVMPAGSGADPKTKYFFAEASGAGLKVMRSFDDGLNPTDVIRVSTKSIGVDEGLNTWLDEVAGVDKSQIIILVRDGGTGSSDLLRNYSMSSEHPFQIPAARLPMPGGGDADLKAFKDVMGTLPPRENPTPPKGAKSKSAAPKDEAPAKEAPAKKDKPAGA